VKHDLGPRWKVDGSAVADVSNITDSLFRPSIFRQAADLPQGFEEIATAILGGSLSNQDLAAMLTGTPVLDSPTRTIFFGNRLFNASLHAGLSFQKSSRFSLRLYGRALHTQTLGSGAPKDTLPSNYLTSKFNSGTAGMGLSYSITPRTQVGTSVETQRIFSRDQDVYATTGIASL